MGSGKLDEGAVFSSFPASGARYVDVVEREPDEPRVVLYDAKGRPLVARVEPRIVGFTPRKR